LLDNSLLVAGGIYGDIVLNTTKRGSLIPLNTMTGRLILPGGWSTARMATIGISGTATISPVTAGSVRVDLGDWGSWAPLTPNQITAITVDLGEDGTNKQIDLRLRYAADRTAIVVKGTISVDTQAPSGSLEVLSQNTISVTLGLSADDPQNLSGIAGMRVGLAGAFAAAPWEPFVPTKTLTMTGGLSPTERILAEFRDGAGNISPRLCRTVDGAACFPHTVYMPILRRS
jgi:hypothetical protein